VICARSFSVKRNPSILPVLAVGLNGFEAYRLAELRADQHLSPRLASSAPGEPIFSLKMIRALPPVLSDHLPSTSSTESVIQSVLNLD
jgi:hypothetical protein